MKKTTVLLLVFLALAVPSVLAQGIKGLPSDCRRDLSQPPVALLGKNDKDRWSKFLSVQPELIGMSKDSVIAAFGKGTTYRKSDELSYRISERKGKLIDLRVKFSRDAVIEYTVSHVLTN